VTRGRRVFPWVLYASMLGLLALTLTFTVLNGSFEGFIVVAVLMMIGYGTVGALLASRVPGNPLGWLMIAIGLGSVLGGFTAEMLTYAYVTEPAASVPFLGVVAWLTNWIWFVFIVSIPLVLMLFPTGTVPSARWRIVARLSVGLGALGALAVMLDPSAVPIEAASIENPTGVDALGDLMPVVLVVVFVGLLIVSLASVVALILRFRRSRGDERQQIRWLAALAVVAGLLLAGTVLSTIAASGEDTLVNGIFWFGLFICIGVAFPAAIGLSIFKYRLYDLDLVMKKTVLYASVALVLVILFLVAAAVLGGAMIDAPPGAIVASILMGVAVWPAVRVARRLADRVVYGGRATPYEVLTDFSHRVAGSYAAEDVLPRMARILAEAVGATRAVVWLRIGGELRPSGIAPVDAAVPEPIRLRDAVPPALSADAVLDVRDQGELLGALAVDMPANDPMNPSKERLVRDLASQAGLVLRNVRLIEELRASRQRLVAAQDEERRKLERNIHDGAQQQLVALTVKLRLLEQLAEREPARVPEMAVQLQAASTEALEELRDLARGIYPPLLANQGLPAALEAQARKAPVPVVVETADLGRFPQEVEAAIYFSCLEALQNVAKYAEASRVSISLARNDGRLSFAVVDDGVGFDPSSASPGTGLQGIADRIDALGGTFTVTSTPGSGTTLAGSVPLASSGPDR
jgi:signal transduction histidine kinase